MGDGQHKRKQGPGGGGSAHKRSKGGSGGRWKTPHQQAKEASKIEMGKALDIGDAGIWVTYARGMRPKALREFKDLCDSYGESLFGVKPPKAEEDASKDAEDGNDIEASIQAELESMKAEQKPKTRQVFTPVGTGLECLFFMKTMSPVEPEKLVRQICQDAKDCPDPRERKTKYINRLTPIFDTDKTTDNGMERVARAVLAPCFELKAESADATQDAAEAQNGSAADSAADSDSTPACTYAIRHNIRNNSALRSDFVIKKIAGLVNPRHKVNLTKPDKVVLVEIFQSYCGISVVDGKEWEDLKRYNVNELYKLAGPDKTEGEKADAAAEAAAVVT